MQQMANMREQTGPWQHHTCRPGNARPKSSEYALVQSDAKSLLDFGDDHRHQAMQHDLIARGQWHQCYDMMNMYAI